MPARKERVSGRGEEVGILGCWFGEDCGKLGDGETYN